MLPAYRAYGTPALPVSGILEAFFGGNMRLTLAVLLFSAAAFAQQSKNPVTDLLRDSLAGRQKNTAAALDDMRPAKFDSSPTPDQTSFGHVATHILEGNY